MIPTLFRNVSESLDFLCNGFKTTYFWKIYAVINSKRSCLIDTDSLGNKTHNCVPLVICLSDKFAKCLSDTNKVDMFIDLFRFILFYKIKSFFIKHKNLILNHNKII